MLTQISPPPYTNQWIHWKIESGFAPITRTAQILSGPYPRSCFSCVRTEIAVSLGLNWHSASSTAISEGRTIRWCLFKGDQLSALLAQDQSILGQLPGREVLFVLDVRAVVRKPHFLVKNAQEQKSLCLGEFGYYQLGWGLNWWPSSQKVLQFISCFTCQTALSHHFRLNLLQNASLYNGMEFCSLQRVKHWVTASWG